MTYLGGVARERCTARIRRQQPRERRRLARKWASCSTTGVIALAIDLADRKPGFQDFVIAHELLHLRVPKHGKLFKVLMSVHVPDWKKRNIQRQSGA